VNQENGMAGDCWIKPARSGSMRIRFVAFSVGESFSEDGNPTEHNDESTAYDAYEEEYFDNSR
jgi:hypothetical protein